MTSAAGTSVISASSWTISRNLQESLGHIYNQLYQASEAGDEALEYTRNRGVDHAVDVISLSTVAEAVRLLQTGG